MNAIKCSNSVELLSNIDSDVQLLLSDGAYDISDIVLPYDKNVYYADDDIGPNNDRELILRSIHNLSIIGSGKTSITSKHQYANIMTFIDCHDIRIQGISFGHWPEMGGCRGGVLVFINCHNIEIESCILFGCGTIGFAAINSNSVHLIKTKITKCNDEIVHLEECENISFSHSEMIDNETREIKILHCDNIVFDHCRIRENRVAEWSWGDSKLFELKNSCGTITLSYSEIDIPEGYLVNNPQLLTQIENSITDEYIYG